MAAARTVLLGAFAVGATACALAACASVLGVEDPIIDLGLDATGGDAQGDGGGSDAVEAGSVDRGVPPDAQGDAACPTKAVDTTIGIFVEPGGTDSAGCGGIGSPCKTIQKGLDHAHLVSGKTTVYVGRGTYLESLSLYAGLTVEGGWEVVDPVWTPTCVGPPNAAVVIMAPPTSNTTILANTLGGNAMLVTLSVRSKATAAAGESIYGIFAHGSVASPTTMTLRDVDVAVVAGGDGAPGAVGVPGTDAVTSCAPPSDGGAGAPPGTNGPGADAGYFAPTGYVGLTGGSGTGGAAGLTGTATTAPACTACVTCTPQLLGGCSVGSNGNSCGAAGKSGCGGGGGGVSGGGGAGGSSVAIYAWDATVTATAGALSAGKGGAGGAGGTFGRGGHGAQGATGDAGPPCAAVSCSAQCNGVPGAGPGGLGSLGGEGSAGGGGGGGAGGWSCDYVQGGTASVTLTSTTTAFSAPGSSTNGAPGIASAKCPP